MIFGVNMGQQFKQMKIKDREQLYKFYQGGTPVKDIADLLGYHRATIYRELARNKSTVGYLPDRANKMALDRCTKPPKLDGNNDLKKYIIGKLKDGWSPEIISGFLKKEKGISVISHETIYAYIYSKEGHGKELYLSLSKRRKKRKPIGSKKNKKTRIPNRTSIHERPENIEEKSTYGHWEGDLMLFRNSNANLITLRERKSRYLLAAKNLSKESVPTAKNIIKKFKGRRKHLIATLTLDNGGEFANHEAIAKHLRIDTFFCDPYSSYQKGSVENANGILRHDFPRSADIDSLSQKDIDKVVNKINNRPMKCLGFSTPAERFKEHYEQMLAA